MRVPYVRLAPDEELKIQVLGAIQGVLESAEFVLGGEVERFERSFASLVGTEFAVGVNSGLDALILALRALDIGPGDEVITVSNSFVATVAAIDLAGAIPVLVDVGSDRNMDPNRLAAAITTRTKAIIPVHLAGHPANMTAIMDIAKRHNLFVIEDAAQAVCATWNGQQIGTFGTIGCFSMHPLKNLGAYGDGGMIVTHDSALQDRLRLLRNHGLRNRDTCEVFGYNSRLDSVQAAVLNCQLPYLKAWTDRRREIARRYSAGLAGLPMILPPSRAEEMAVYHAYVVRTSQREELIRHLAEAGVDAKVHYPMAIHHQEAFIRKYGRVRLPETDRQGNEILSLPVNPSLTDEEVDYVIHAIRAFFQREA